MQDIIIYLKHKGPRFSIQVIAHYLNLKKFKFFLQFKISSSLRRRSMLVFIRYSKKFSHSLKRFQMVNYAFLKLFHGLKNDDFFHITTK